MSVPTEPMRCVRPRQGQREEHFAEDMPFMGQGLAGSKKVSGKRQAETLPQGQVRVHALAFCSDDSTLEGPP